MDSDIVKRHKYMRDWYMTIFQGRLYTKKDMKNISVCYIFKNENDRDKYLNKYPELLHSKGNYFLCESNPSCIVGQRFLEVYLVSSNFEKLIKELVKQAQECYFKSDVVLLECEKLDA